MMDRWKLAFSVIATVVTLGGTANAEESVTDQMRAGEWKCAQGSYALRACTVSHQDGKVTLRIPDGAGHRMPLSGELLPTDEAGKVVFVGNIDGKYVDFESDCAASETTDVEGCRAAHAAAKGQQMRVLLERKKDGSWRGVMPFFIVRGKWNGSGVASSWYHAGAWDDLRLVPPKK